VSCADFGQASGCSWPRRLTAQIRDRWLPTSTTSSRLSLWWSTSSTVIFNSMDRAITTPACVVAWLLCAVLVCLVVHPPHCDMCDGPLTGISSSPQTIASQQQPATPEPCNGMCWCCGFHGLPNANPDLGPVNAVTSNVRPEPLSPVFALRSSIFRPPRTGVSSLLGHPVPLAWMLQRTT
jgi:hypothetical protein